MFANASKTRSSVVKYVWVVFLKRPTFNILSGWVVSSRGARRHQLLSGQTGSAGTSWMGAERHWTAERLMSTTPWDTAGPTHQSPLVRTPGTNQQPHVAANSPGRHQYTVQLFCRRMPR